MIARTLLLLCLALALPAQAAARPPAIGIGEQKPGMFDDARFQRLGLSEVRYIAPWDVIRDADQRDKLDDWMAAARASGSRVVLGFQHSLRSRRRARTLPTPLRSSAPSSGSARAIPTCATGSCGTRPTTRSRSPPTARAAPRGSSTSWRGTARGCRIVAADVLDVSGMTAWVRRFQRHAVHRPRIWGLHNYVDANRFGSAGTARCCGPRPGRSGSPRRAGWCSGASTPGRR